MTNACLGSQIGKHDFVFKSYFFGIRPYRNCKYCNQKSYAIPKYMIKPCWETMKHIGIYTPQGEVSERS